MNNRIEIKLSCIAQLKAYIKSAYIKSLYKSIIKLLIRLQSENYYSTENQDWKNWSQMLQFCYSIHPCCHQNFYQLIGSPAMSWIVRMYQESYRRMRIFHQRREISWNDSYSRILVWDSELFSVFRGSLFTWAMIFKVTCWKR